jgi:hypothetical protein
VLAERFRQVSYFGLQVTVASVGLEELEVGFLDIGISQVVGRTFGPLLRYSLVLCQTTTSLAQLAVDRWKVVRRRFRAMNARVLRTKYQIWFEHSTSSREVCAKR